MISLLMFLLRMSSCFHRGVKGTFSSIVDELWWKGGLQKGVFSATFLPRLKDRPQRWDPFEHWRKGDRKTAFLKGRLSLVFLNNSWRLSMYSRPLLKEGSAAISECCLLQVKTVTFQLKILRSHVQSRAIHCLNILFYFIILYSIQLYSILF